MKKKIRKTTFPKKIAIERTPIAIGLVAPSQPTSLASGIHGSGFHPPRKRRVNTPDPINMWEYSATKKSDHLNAPYSVWKPPTRSASDSGMSKGCRFVSAKSDVMKMNADTGMMKINQ